MHCVINLCLLQLSTFPIWVILLFIVLFTCPKKCASRNVSSQKIYSIPTQTWVHKGTEHREITHNSSKSSQSVSATCPSVLQLRCRRKRGSQDCFKSCGLGDEKALLTVTVEIPC